MEKVILMSINEPQFDDRKAAFSSAVGMGAMAVIAIAILYGFAKMMHLSFLILLLVGALGLFPAYTRWRTRQWEQRRQRYRQYLAKIDDESLYLALDNSALDESSRIEVGEWLSRHATRVSGAVCMGAVNRKQ